MKKNKILATDFYEFQCPEDLFNLVLAEIPTLQFNKDPSNYSTGYYYNAELFSWFNECLDVVAKDLLAENLKFEISNCWLNKAYKSQKTPLHLHPQSILSSVMYFADSESGRTIFKSLNPWYKVQFENFLHLTNDRRKLFNTDEIKPQAGKLVLFPSTVFHEVSVYTGNDPRYTLSFNAFVTGEFHDPKHNAVTDYLNIKTLFPYNK